ncbi:MAG: DNA recombination protein RmuC, partial [Terracidiphilus sp.]
MLKFGLTPAILAYIRRRGFFVESLAVYFALIAVAIFVFGLWVGFRQGRAGAQSQLDQALANERKLAETRMAAQEEKYAQMKAGLDSAFNAAAADALRANTQSFLDLAKQQLSGQTSEAKLTLEAKELAIKKMLDPLNEALGKLDTQTREMEKAREGAYGKVETLVSEMKDAIPKSLEGLQRETAQLITALRSPKTRGNWGELQLKRCVEYAGMVQYCSFSEQVTARD